MMTVPTPSDPEEATRREKVAQPPRGPRRLRGVSRLRLRAAARPPCGARAAAERWLATCLGIAAGQPTSPSARERRIGRAEGLREVFRGRPAHHPEAAVEAAEVVTFSMDEALLWR
jgi:hypothetical protein